MGIIKYLEKDSFELRLEARLKNAKLMQARERLGLTQKEVAEEIGINPSSLGNYECLRGYPKETTQKKICDFYRKKGLSFLEEEVFPIEIKKVQIRKVVVDKKISKETMISINYLVPREKLTISSNMEEEIISKEVSEKVKEILDYVVQVSPQVKESDIQILYDRIDGLTLKEVGEKIGISRERVRQREAKVKRILRNPKYSKLLKPLLR